jgi:hypothetical protein
MKIDYPKLSFFISNLTSVSKCSLKSNNRPTWRIIQYSRENSAEREVGKSTQFNSAVSLKLDNSVPRILQMENIFIPHIGKVDKKM